MLMMYYVEVPMNKQLLNWPQVKRDISQRNGNLGNISYLGVSENGEFLRCTNGDNYFGTPL